MLNLQKGKYYVTVAGGKQLEDEFEALQKKRGEVAENIRKAKAFGDLSENFEYHEAKREQGFMEGRISQLKIIVPNMAVVHPDQVTRDQVGFGSLVTVREDTGDEWEFVIVGPLEADPMEDRISYESPLGEALWGHRVGDTVTAKVPAGDVTYEIIGLDVYQG